MEQATSSTGWWNPRPLSSNSKFHYVGSSGRTLCKRWLYLGGVLEEGKDDHSDNCAACKRERAKT